LAWRLNDSFEFVLRTTRISTIRFVGLYCRASGGSCAVIGMLLSLELNFSYSFEISIWAESFGMEA